MFVAVVFLFILCQINGDSVRYRCGKSSANVTFTPATDGVEGRYTVESCMSRNPKIIAWRVELWYYDVKTCHSLKKPNFTHSQNTELIKDDTNCTNVCYSMDFDLIFAGCYNIQSVFDISDKDKKRSTRPIDTPCQVNNNLTLQGYEAIKPLATFIPNDIEATLHWRLGLPVSDYEVMLAQKKTIDGEYSDHTTNITGNCSTVAWNEVLCLLTLPEGCYNANFQHQVAWSAVLNGKTSVNFKFCRDHVDTPVVRDERTHVLWACGGILLGALAIVALLVARHMAKTKSYYKSVLQAWRASRERELPQPVSPSKPTVLLLYAREGEHGQRALAALRDLLEELTGGQVVDIYAEETVAACGSAAGAWLHETLLSPHTAVLLLQSPALAALYSAALNPDQLTLQEPLLGRRVMYRCPHMGDQLLLLALRLLTETVSAHNNYNKYYLATLETDILKQVVPYRRYILPQGAGTLARDLGAPPLDDSHAPLLDTFTTAAEDFIQNVTDNPDYLVDDLLIM